MEIKLTNGDWDMVLVELRLAYEKLVEEVEVMTRQGADDKVSWLIERRDAIKIIIHEIQNQR